MYDIVRLIASVIIVSILLVLVRKTTKLMNIKQKPFFIITSGLFTVFLLYFILDFIPFENLFMGFESPKKAFVYQHNSEVLDVIEYDDCALIFSRDNDSEYGIFTTVIIKQDGKWKLDSVLTRKSRTVFKGWCCIEYEQVPKSEDCFVIVSGDIDDFFLDTTDNIKDDRGTEFHFIQYPTSRKIYYGLIKDIGSDYVIYIDDIPVPWINEEE